MTLFRAVLATVALLAPSAVRAQDSLAATCDTALTTLDMRRCAGRDLQNAERDLARYVAEARRIAANVALVDSAQRAWERYRDIQCRAAENEVEDGTMQPLVALNCLAALTRQRIQALWDGHIRLSDSQLPNPQVKH